MEQRLDKVNIGYKIRIIHNDIGKYFNTCWKKEKIEPTRMQCATMHYLKRHGKREVFQKDLETEFSISGATASNILKIMEKDGLICRIPMENDARLKRIELTEAGRQLNDSAEGNIYRLEEGMKKGFTEEELTRFSEYLNRLSQNIQDLVEEASK